MNWPVILSMILILIVGIVTYRSGRVTESVVLTLVLLMIFYIVYGHYYYSAEAFEENSLALTPKQEMTALIMNKLITQNPTFMQDFSSLGKDVEDNKITVKDFVDQVYKLVKRNETIISTYNVTVEQFLIDFFEFLRMSAGASKNDKELQKINEVITYAKEINNKSSSQPTVTGLPVTPSISQPIVTGLPVTNQTTVTGLPITQTPARQEIKLTYKQKTAENIAYLMNEKYNKEWMMRIIKRIGDAKPDRDNPPANLPQIAYDASLPEKPLFDAIIKDNNIRDMTFDEFFISMVEIFIENNKNPLSPMYKFASKVEPLFQLWKVKHLAAVVPAAVVPAAVVPAAVVPAASGPSASGSEPAPAKGLSELNKLLQVLKPATATTVVPSASASEIGAIVKTSPGLQQGNQYTEVAAARTFPKPGPRCPQPAPQSHCSCQKPIMPDGKPFDPNMYIRKDSIPCWNCQLPI